MHNKFIACIGLILLPVMLYGQQTAITQTGEQVVLYSDGTWVYVERDTMNMEEIPTHDGAFTKSKNASFLLKSKRIGIGCWLDPKKWKFVAATENEVAEFEIDHLKGSLYGMILTEHLDIPTESLGNIAIENARDAAPDIKVLEREYRYVNGLKVLKMRMTGTIQDIRFSYYGYYYASDGGATQFLVYAAEDFMEKNIPVVEELLNGLVEVQE